MKFNRFLKNDSARFVSERSGELMLEVTRDRLLGVTRAEDVTVQYEGDALEFTGTLRDSKGPVIRFPGDDGSEHKAIANVQLTLKLDGAITRILIAGHPDESLE